MRRGIRATGSDPSRRLYVEPAPSIAMSVRAESNASALNTVPQDMGAAIAEATPENNHLAEGAAYATATPENPLTRNLAVSIRASLNGAPAPFKNPSAPHTPSRAEPPRSRLSRAVPPEEQGRVAAVAGGAQGDLPAGTAASRRPPDPAYVRSPLALTLAEALHLARRHLGADGRPQGTPPPRPDVCAPFRLRIGLTLLSSPAQSVVLHDMRVTHVKSSFPMALGAKISAVDGAPPALAFPIRSRLVAHPPCLCRRQDVLLDGRGACPTSPNHSRCVPSYPVLQTAPPSSFLRRSRRSSSRTRSRRRRARCRPTMSRSVRASPCRKPTVHALNLPSLTPLRPHAAYEFSKKFPGVRPRDDCAAPLPALTRPRVRSTPPRTSPRRASTRSRSAASCLSPQTIRS